MTNQKPPLISPEWCDLPTQRLYVASFLALFQSYKLFQFIELWWFGSNSSPKISWIYWSSLDLILVAVIIPLLNIPRLKLAKLQTIIIIGLLFSFNWICLGNSHLGLTLISSLLPQSIKRLFDYQTAILEVKVRLQDVINPSSHILGKHTIHVLPHTTAKLNPHSNCFCISSSISSSFALIPIIFNNSIPHLLQYSVTNFTTGQKTLFNLTHSQLHPSSSKQKKSKFSLEDWIEDEENDWKSSDDQLQQPLNHQSNSRDQPALERTQLLYHLDVRQIGLIRLERVLDQETMDIRISRAEALVVDCPRASFTTTDQVSSSHSKLLSWVGSNPVDELHKCVDETEDFGMMVHGLAPLTLNYHRIIDGERTPMRLEGISPSEFVSPLIPTETATLSEKLRISHRNDYNWAESSSIDLPLNISLTTTGKHIYELDSVRDACGHTFDFNSLRESRAIKRFGSGPELLDTKTVYVHPRSQVSFLGCGNTEDEPLRLLKGKSVPLKIHVKEADEAVGSPWTVGVSYKPVIDPDSKESLDSNSKKGWEQNITFSDSIKLIQATQPGTYELTSINGKFCSGEILVPSSCIVVEQPIPTIEFNFTSITDQCSGEIGLKANFLLTGKPPFKLHYLVSQSGRSTQKKIKVIQHSRDEILIQPDSPGDFEYKFVQLDDQYYNGIKIPDQSIKQIVHPLAQAKFTRGGKDENIWSCDGETVEAEIELKGAPPYTIVYQILGEKAHTVKDINSARAVLDVDIPSQYITKGGSFTLSLVSITDGNGCLRNLTVPDLNIEVHRTKPTVKFYSADQQYKLVGREGEPFRIPMRLTGNGPWKIEYSLNGRTSLSEEKTVFSPNAHLEVTQAGEYQLLAIHDQHCPGTVESGRFKVEWLPRPSLTTSSQHGSGVIIKESVCEMVDDSLELTLAGSPPFSVRYSVLHQPFGRGERSSVEEKTVQFLKSNAILPLHTSEAGSYTYTITAISDRTYPKLSSHGLKDLPSIKQLVYELPSGTVKTLAQTTYCVHESLSTTQNGKGGVRLDLIGGKAPYQVDLQVTNEVSMAMERFELNFTTASTVLSLPYVFRSAAPHSINVKSVKDGNGCTSKWTEESTQKSAIVEVAETASIESVSKKPYICVGERLEYILKGSPPWLIKYEFQSKPSSIIIDSKNEPKFSRLAKEPGLFRILAIAHKLDHCLVKVNLEKLIKPIPSVKISAGRNFIEDIREGDQSEIVFSFEGTPPFSFTYTRSLPEDRTDDTRILEKRTVTGIESHTYSIFAREEGTWSVTEIQDAFCSFPPVGGLGDNSNEKKIK